MVRALSFDVACGSARSAHHLAHHLDVSAELHEVRTEGVAQFVKLHVGEMPRRAYNVMKLL